MRGRNPERDISEMFETVREHVFHPVDERNFTVDRNLDTDGIADLDDNDWRIRSQTISTLVQKDPDAIIAGLEDDNTQVRYLTAMSLGILGRSDAVSALERVAKEDSEGIVRARAVMSLGQIASGESRSLLAELQHDEDRDIAHQATLAYAQMEAWMGSTDALRKAYRDLDLSRSNRIQVGDQAPEIELDDTVGGRWSLTSRLGQRWVVLVWIFADWCPVCHREFDELLDAQERFERLGVDIATIECHDTFRGRVMVGKEIEPEYWFADEPFLQTYREQVWWPHLLDRAGGTGIEFGIDPLAFAVHAEYINRPTTVIIDPSGEVRFMYQGTFWGDRPTIEQTLGMIETETFDFEHPERLKAAGSAASHD